VNDHGNETASDWLVWIIILLIALGIIFAVHRSMYRECMEKRHDEVLCEIYARPS
jgi:uncharacterized Rmd1/YagE family protein